MRIEAIKRLLLIVILKISGTKVYTLLDNGVGTRQGLSIYLGY